MVERSSTTTFRLQVPQAMIRFIHLGHVPHVGHLSIMAQAVRCPYSTTTLTSRDDDKGHARGRCGRPKRTPEEI